MVGWVCSLISNSQQNMGLIKQFALLFLLVGKRRLRGELGPPTGKRPLLQGGGCSVEGKARR